MDEQDDLLIEIINDPQARPDEREDAMMYLGDIDTDKGLNALLQFAQMEMIVSDPVENDILLDSCGESIAQIWVKRNHFEKEIYKDLSGIVKDSVRMYIINQKPEWENLL